MEAQLPPVRTDLTEGADAADPTELRAIGGALLTRLAELRERDMVVPDELWRAAERFQPLLDGIDPDPGEGEELWELALALPGLLARAKPAAAAAPRAGAVPRSDADPAPGLVPAPVRVPVRVLALATVPVPVPVPTAGLLVCDGVEHVEPRGA
jgi:hypothetical protein